MAINKGPSIISPLSLNVLPTAYGDCPPEGKRFIPYYIDWSTEQSFTLDFTVLQELRRFSFIQSMIIDNFLEVGDSITITINNFFAYLVQAQQSTTIFPILSKQQTVITIASQTGAATGNSRILFCNFGIVPLGINV